MLYDSIKTIHVLSGTVVMSTLFLCMVAWWNQPSHYLKSIGLKTGLLIVPFALVQLLSGFTLLSLRPDYLSQLWTKGTVLSFIVGLGAWFWFLVLLYSEKRNRRLEIVALAFCISSLLTMLFFMANKT